MTVLDSKAHAALSAELKALQTENERHSATLTQWAKHIVLYKDGRFCGDHACIECYPHSDIIVKGFRCVYHQAKSLIAEDAEPSIRISV